MAWYYSFDRLGVITIIMKGRRHVHNTLSFLTDFIFRALVFQDSKTDYDGGTGIEQVAENQEYEEVTTYIIVTYIRRFIT